MCYNGKLDAKNLVSEATRTLIQVNEIYRFQRKIIYAITHNENHRYIYPNTAVGKTEYK
jgi:hypothetical protein